VGLYMANIAYVRVSTVEQNEQQQIEMLEKYNIDKWFIEKVSAKDTNRPQFKAMLNYIRAGDTVHIRDFSRLARSTRDLLDTIDIFTQKNVNFISTKENIDISTPTGKLMLTMIAAINEFERSNLLERQKEGIEIAKRKGKYKGRRKIKIADFDKYYQMYKTRELNKSQLAKQLNISRPTLDKLIQQHETVTTRSH
jgi:Site-specific recombinases, DNA invertase Pin homologs